MQVFDVKKSFPPVLNGKRFNDKGVSSNRRSVVKSGEGGGGGFNDTRTI